MCWLQSVQCDGLRFASGPNDCKELGVPAVDLEGTVIGRFERPVNCISANKDVSAVVQLSIDVRFVVGVVSGLLRLYLLHGGTEP